MVPGGKEKLGRGGHEQGGMEGWVSRPVERGKGGMRIFVLISSIPAYYYRVYVLLHSIL